MEEKSIVRYTARDGTEIKLDYDTILKFLVQGKSDLITKQEMTFFLGICKARGLNPFARDCYLVKYSNETPAAIIVSIDYFRARARAQEDCVGWSAGIIVQDKEGKVKRSAGLLLDGETLVGGWFSAKPRGWNEPFELEVNLRGYIKTKRDGTETKFWDENNRVYMIRKVAESQGLRTLWPSEFQGLMSDEELQPPIDTTFISEKTEYRPDPEKIKEFDKITEGEPRVDEYLKACADHFDKSVDQVKEEIVTKNQRVEFLGSLRKWVESHTPVEAKPEDAGSNIPKRPWSEAQQKAIWATMTKQFELNEKEGKSFIAWYQAKPGVEVVDVDGKPRLTVTSAGKFIDNMKSLFTEFTKA